MKRPLPQQIEITQTFLNAAKPRSQEHFVLMARLRELRKQELRQIVRNRRREQRERAA